MQPERQDECAGCCFWRGTAFPIGWQGELRVVPTAANRQPAMATYIRPPGASDFRLAALSHVSEWFEFAYNAMATY